MLEFLRDAGFIISVFQGPLMPLGREVLRLSMRADLSHEDTRTMVPICGLRRAVRR